MSSTGQQAPAFIYTYKPASLTLEFDLSKEEVMISFEPADAETIFTKIDADGSVLDILNMNEAYGFARLRTKHGKSMSDALSFLGNIKEVTSSLPAMIPKEKGKKGIVYLLSNRVVVEFVNDKEAQKYIKDHGLKVIKQHKTPALYTISTKVGSLQGMSLQDSLGELNDTGLIVSAYPFRVDFDLQSWNAKNYFYNYNYQWGLRNTGGPPFGGIADEDSDVDQAWNIIPYNAAPATNYDLTLLEANTTRGNNSIIMCVVDSGVYGDYSIAPPTYHQAFEDVTPTEKRIQTGVNFITGGNTQDTDGHGTAVTGVVVARRSNTTPPSSTNYKVVGVAPKAKVMPLKIVDLWASGFTFADLVDAIKYIGRSAVPPADPGGLAIVNAATTRYIILIPFNYTTEDFPTRDAINQAVDNNVLVVCSAGQTGAGGGGQNLDTSPVYPGAQTKVVCVGALNYMGNRYSESNFGTQVIGAPGEAIYTTFNSGLTAYGSVTGSSMAAAFVAGIAALVWHRHHKVHAGFVAPGGAGYLPAYAAGGAYSVHQLIRGNGIAAPATNFGRGKANTYETLRDVT